MTDITEIIDRLGANPEEKADPNAISFVRGPELLAIVAAYREQAAELAKSDEMLKAVAAQCEAAEREVIELREKLRKCEEQEPIGHFYHRPQEGRVGVEWCCKYLHDGAALYADPKPAPVSVPEGYEPVLLKSDPYGWRYAVQGAVDLLRSIERNGQLNQGGEQYPNALNCIESVQRLSAMLAEQEKK